jgi:hypothetical protein
LQIVTKPDGTLIEVWSGAADHEAIITMVFDLLNHFSAPAPSHDGRPARRRQKHFIENEIDRDFVARMCESLRGELHAAQFMTEAYVHYDHTGDLRHLIALYKELKVAQAGHPSYAKMDRSKPEVTGIHFADLYVDWSWPGCGFGQLSFKLDRNTGEWKVDNECMGAESVRQILHAAADAIADRLAGPIERENTRYDEKLETPIKTDSEVENDRWAALTQELEG